MSVMPQPTRILLADDHALVRHGLRMILDAEPDLTVVAEAATAPRRSRHSSKEIAEMLVISVKTVDRHRANILAKLGLRDRLDLTRHAIRAGLVEP